MMLATIDESAEANYWSTRAAELSNILIDRAIEKGDMQFVETVFRDGHAFQKERVGELLSVLSLSPKDALARYNAIGVREAIADHVVRVCHKGSVEEALSKEDSVVCRAIIANFAK